MNEAVKNSNELINKKCQKAKRKGFKEDGRESETKTKQKNVDK